MNNTTLYFLKKIIQILDDAINSFKKVQTEIKTVIEKEEKNG